MSISGQYYSKAIDSHLQAILPSYDQKVRIRSEPDFYGASKLISEYIGLKKTPKSFASWSHGVCFFDLKYLEQVIWSKGWKCNRLIANDNVKSFIANFKVGKVKAVGLPIIYVPSQNIARRKNSVLIMLAHSLPYCKFEHDLSGMFDFCSKLKDDGCYVCFCIHLDCFLQGRVTAELDKKNIDWFVGSSVEDANSLKRMRNIFEYFETVASNAIGSHFYYAQLFGSKFFFVEPFFEYSKELLKYDPNYKDKSAILEHNLIEISLSVVKRKFPNYFCDYKDALCDQALAEKECGVSNKLEPQELAKLLGWGLKDQLLSPFFYYGSKLVNMFKSRFFRK
jgi:hypothetical protein